MTDQLPERAVQIAAGLGHTVEWDPPGLSSARRWTCPCGLTVIDYAGNIYGSATTQWCPLAARVEHPAEDGER